MFYNSLSILWYILIFIVDYSQSNFARLGAKSKAKKTKNCLRVSANELVLIKIIIEAFLPAGDRNFKGSVEG